MSYINIITTLYNFQLKSSLQGNSRPIRADTLAFDIQRGRDHGLQSYVEYLQICSNTKIKNWSDLEHFIRTEVIFMNFIQSYLFSFMPFAV